MDTHEKFAPMRKGLLETVLLTIISSRKVYVADMLKELASTEFRTQEGTLYPLLSKLRREKLVDYQWVESESGPPRKYYCLTDTGKNELKSQHAYIRNIITLINSLGKNHE